MAWRVVRNPGGPGYVLQEDDGTYMNGPSGRRVFSSEREAADTGAQDDAFGQDTTPEEAAEANERLRAEQQAAADRRAASEDPAERQRRRDAGEDPSGGYSDEYADDRSRETEDQWVSDLAGVPLIGGPADAERAAQEADRARSDWDSLGDWMPTPDDLAVDYRHEGNIEGPQTTELSGAAADPEAIAAERRALAGLDDVWSHGGLTDADRSRLAQSQAETGRAMRGQREADQASLNARGMGGSGAELASMLGAQQGGVDAMASRDAEVNINAEDRAMQALSGMGSLGSRMRGESWEEDTTRRGSLDELARWNTDYQRGREERNTGYDHDSGESRSRARQQAYENRERQTAGKQGVWQAAESGRRADAVRSDGQAEDVVGGVGTLLEELL